MNDLEERAYKLWFYLDTYKLVLGRKYVLEGVGLRDELNQVEADLTLVLTTLCEKLADAVALYSDYAVRRMVDVDLILSQINADRQNCISYYKYRSGQEQIRLEREKELKEKEKQLVLDKTLEKFNKTFDQFKGDFGELEEKPKLNELVEVKDDAQSVGSMKVNEIKKKFELSYVGGERFKPFSDVKKELKSTYNHFKDASLPLQEDVYNETVHEWDKAIDPVVDVTYLKDGRYEVQCSVLGLSSRRSGHDLVRTIEETKVGVYNLVGLKENYEPFQVNKISYVLGKKLFGLMWTRLYSKYRDKTEGFLILETRMILSFEALIKLVYSNEFTVWTLRASSINRHVRSERINVHLAIFYFEFLNNFAFRKYYTEWIKLNHTDWYDEEVVKFVVDFPSDIYGKDAQEGMISNKCYDWTLREYVLMGT